MKKTIKEILAEKTSEILRERGLTYTFRLKGSPLIISQRPLYPTAETILAIIEAFEEAQRTATKDEAFELTQKLSHEPLGLMDWTNN